MAEIRAATYEDKEYDSCGNTVVAVFENNQMTIPLCRDCLDNLISSIDVFTNTIFCHQCRYFNMSSSGWHYGGRCIKHDRDRDCMETCDDAIRKEQHE